jgi:ABC-2 type transport system ATP-binding protein
MKRKLELSMTMSVDVPLYLLDEPTAGVDLTNIQRFHDIILEAYDEGKTFLVSSHRPMDANIADRIAFMPDGTVTAVGTPEELMDAVPPVVRVTGSDAIREAESFVVDGQLFPLGGEARGFLAPGCDFDDVTDRLGDSVECIDPTYTDLFNYYVHVEGIDE